MKQSLLFLLGVLMSMALCAQETLVPSNAPYKYFVGTEEPASEWKNSNFDDSAWADGWGSIGYGDDPDSTQLTGPVTSVYLRVPFQVEDLEAVKTIQLEPDYDDGFVAYINGVEVARKNLGKKGEEIPFNRLADRSHDAFFSREYNCSFLRGYYLDSALLKTCLKQGENLLTIQVHNDRADGDDLSCRIVLNDISGFTYDPYSYSMQNIRQVEMVESHLPILVLETEENGFEKCKEWVDGSITVYYNTNGELNNRETATPAYTSAITAKTRGNSSQRWPKINLAFDLKDSEGADTSVALLGMPEESDWVLFGPYADRSLIRNALAFEISHRTGEYAPRYRFCEMVLNGDYMGVYQVIEKIKRDRNRVDISSLNPDENSGLDLTGGYIFKYDWGPGSPVAAVYPRSSLITYEQKKYLRNKVLHWEDFVEQDDFMEHATSYRDLMDVESYLNFTITYEISLNPDAYRISTYMHKDRDDIDPRIKFGPVWDFDLAFGIGNSTEAQGFTGWSWKAGKELRHKYLFRDTALVNQFVNRWETLRSDKLSNDQLMFLVDSLYDVIGPSKQRNYEVWPLEGENFNSWWGNFSNSFEMDSIKTKQWIIDRVGWIDENIGKIYYKYDPPVVGLSDDINVFVGPNPCQEYITVSADVTITEPVKLILYSVYGQPIYQTAVEPVGGRLNETINVGYFTDGVYLLKLEYPDGSFTTVEVVKN